MDTAACALLLRYQAAPDPDVLARLFELTQPYLESVAAGVAARLGRRGDEDDLLSNFFVKLVAGRLPPGGMLRSFFAFARITMRNDALSGLRRAGREARRHSLYEQTRSAPVDPACIAEQAELVEELPRVWAVLLGVANSAFELLRPRDRQALLLRAVEGLPCADVASRLGVRRGQGGMVVKRARDRYVDQVQAAFDAQALRRRLAGLTYEAIKGHLLRDPESALRIEQQQQPRGLGALREVLRDVDAQRQVASHWSGGQAWEALAGVQCPALESVQAGLSLLERLEGRSARWGLVSANLLIQQRRGGEARQVLGEVARGDPEGHFLPLTLSNVARAFNREQRWADVDAVVRHAQGGDDRFALLSYNHSVALAHRGQRDAFLAACRRVAAWVGAGRAPAVRRMILADLDATAGLLGLGRGTVASAYGLT